MQKLSRRRAVDHLVRTDVRTPYACVRQVRTCCIVKAAGKVTVKHLCRVVGTQLVRTVRTPCARGPGCVPTGQRSTPYASKRSQCATNRGNGRQIRAAAGAIKQYMDKRGIERDLGERIGPRPETKLAKAALAKETSQTNLKTHAGPDHRPAGRVVSQSAPLKHARRRGADLARVGPALGRRARRMPPHVARCVRPDMQVLMD